MSLKKQITTASNFKMKGGEDFEIVKYSLGKIIKL